MVKSGAGLSISGTAKMYEIEVIIRTWTKVHFFMRPPKMKKYVDIPPTL